MIHQYKLGGYNIVLDVCSGGVHVVDDVAYDIISLFENPSREDILAAMKDKYLGTDGITEADIEEAEIEIKYSGYIERERQVAEKLHRLENISIPEGFDYSSMQSLTIEARQKLEKIRPITIAQASRIPGVSPADISVLLVYLGGKHE